MGSAGCLGIDVDRRGVKRDFGAALGQQEARDAADLDAQSRGERQLDPGRVLAGRQAIALALDRKLRAAVALHAEAEWDFHRERFFVQTVGRALDRAVAKLPSRTSGMRLPLSISAPAGSGGVQRESALRARAGPAYTWRKACGR